MGLKAAIYTRVSTEEQRDYGYSIDGQLRELKDYCKKKKYDVVGIYNDAGFSGKNMNRPNLDRLIEDIRNNMVDVIVSIKVDRLTRDGYDGQWLLKFCNENDVILDLLYEQYDINTVNGEMMYGMNLLFAQRERKEIGARTRRGLEEAIRQGKYPSGAPLGYVRNEEGRLEVDPVSSLVIKEIFELYSKGYSMNSIAEKFRLEKKYNRKSTKWKDITILNILSNPIYKGECHWRRTMGDKKQNPVLVMPNHSPKIITEELFERCQEQVEKNKHGGFGKHVHIFHDLVKCPTCGKPLSNYFTVKTTRKGDKVDYFFVICKNDICEDKGKIYNTEKIEKSLIKLLNSLAVDYQKSEYSLLFSYQKKDSEIVEIDRALYKLKKDESKLLELYLNTNLNVEVINKKNEAIQNEIKKLEIKRAKFEEDKIEQSKNSLEELFNNKNENCLSGIDNIWNLLPRIDRKLILNKYIKSIEIKTDSSHNIAVNNITFRDEFIKSGAGNLTEIVLDCIKESNKNLVIKSPIIETSIEIDSHISVNEYVKKGKYYFDKFWQNILKESRTIYPIIDIKNEIKDLIVSM